MKVRDIILSILTMTENLSSERGMKALYTDYATQKLLSELQKMIRDKEDKEIEENEITALKIIFKDYFAVLKKTNFISLFDSQSKLTITYMVLAQALESITGISRFQFMLPEVVVVDYEASSTSLHDPDLQLTDFVLSDDDTFIIEVLACLNFAVEDGQLKHTRLFNGQMKTLSETEADRVIHHSPEAKSFWKTIQDKVNFELHGESFGAVLKQLANKLAKGGAYGNRGGSEFNAGADANTGIQEFFEWLNILTSEEHETLSGVKAPGLSYSLGELLGRLARPADVNFAETRFCVEIIGGNIDTILHYNPQLFNTYPINKSLVSAIGIEQMQARLTVAHDNLKKAMSDPQYRVLSTYPNSNEVFTKRVCNLPNLAEVLGEKINAHIKTIDDVLFILEKIEISNRYKFLSSIKKLLQGITKLHWDGEINSLISMLASEEEKIKLTKIFSKQICDLIHTSSDFHKVLSSYPEKCISPLVKILMEENPNLFISKLKVMPFILQHWQIGSDSLLEVLRHLPKKDRLQFALAQSNLIVAQNDLNYITSVLKCLPNHARGSFILNEKISSVFKHFIENGNHLLMVLDCLPGEHRLQVALAYQHIIQDKLPDTVLVLDCLPSYDCLRFIERVSLKNFKDIFLIFNRLPEECHFEFILKYRDRIKTIKDFFKLLDCLSEDNKQKVIDSYPHQDLLTLLWPFGVGTPDYIDIFKRAALYSEYGIAGFCLRILNSQDEGGIIKIIFLLRIPYLANKIAFDKQGLMEIAERHPLLAQEIIENPSLSNKIKDRLDELGYENSKIAGYLFKNCLPRLSQAGLFSLNQGHKKMREKVLRSEDAQKKLG
jgi:hypothetical protein